MRTWKRDGYIVEERVILEEIITVQEAAEILGITERGVRWNCESGKYKARKAGKVWLIDRKSIEMQKAES